MVSIMKRILFLVLFLDIPVAVWAGNQRLSVWNQTTTNVVVGGLVVPAGDRVSWRLPVEMSPLSVDFGGTNYNVALDGAVDLILGENVWVERSEWLPWQYMSFGFSTAGVMAVTGWGLLFARKVLSASPEV